MGFLNSLGKFASGAANVAGGAMNSYMQGQGQGGYGGGGYGQQQPFGLSSLFGGGRQGGPSMGEMARNAYQSGKGQVNNYMQQHGLDKDVNSLRQGYNQFRQDPRQMMQGYGQQALGHADNYLAQHGLGGTLSNMFNMGKSFVRNPGQSLKSAANYGMNQMQNMGNQYLDSRNLRGDFNQAVGAGRQFMQDPRQGMNQALQYGQGKLNEHMMNTYGQQGYGQQDGGQGGYGGGGYGQQQQMQQQAPRGGSSGQRMLGGNAGNNGGGQMAQQMPNAGSQGMNPRLQLESPRPQMRQGRDDFNLQQRQSSFASGGMVAPRYGRHMQDDSSGMAEGGAMEDEHEHEQNPYGLEPGQLEELMAALMNSRGDRYEHAH